MLMSAGVISLGIWKILTRAFGADQFSGQIKGKTMGGSTVELVGGPVDGLVIEASSDLMELTIASLPDLVAFYRKRKDGRFEYIRTETIGKRTAEEAGS